MALVCVRLFMPSALPLLAFGTSLFQAGVTALLESRSASVTAMTSAQELAFAIPARFASAAYCSPDSIATWSCGLNCDSLPGVKVYATGGDGTETQYWYVGYDAGHLSAIIVGHQGTNPSSLVADLTDLKMSLIHLNSTIFPGLSSNIRAHSGFLDTHSRSAGGVLAGINAALADTGSTTVWIVGHSLGGAIALLDAIYLPLHLPSTTSFHTNTFGMPRVGNQAFADYVDAYVTNFAHVTNKHDVVPILPDKFLGFRHPSNEKHIATSGTADGDWYACDGQDNTNIDCSTGAVPTVADGSISDHDGPYGVVEMGC